MEPTVLDINLEFCFFTSVKKILQSSATVCRLKLTAQRLLSYLPEYNAVKQARKYFKNFFLIKAQLKFLVG